MQQEPILDFFVLPHRGGKQMAYWSWGDSAAKHVVLCVHGLTRQGRDFDALAKALLNKASSRSESIRVICLDIVGRGKSDWLDDAMTYSVPLYAQDVVTFLTALYQQQPYDQLDWVGTSMGGLIGMGVIGGYGMGEALLPLPVRRLVLNDVGPTIEWSSLLRIGSYLGRHKPNVGIWASEQEGADEMWQLASSFGPHTQDEWLALSRYQMKQCLDGRYTFAYDPAIATLFKSASRESTTAGEAFLWQLYRDISAETLITRGQESDLLSLTTATRMCHECPKMPVPARLVEFGGVGHAPTFVAKDQHDVVVQFLMGE